MAIDRGLDQFLDWGTTTTIATSVGKVLSGTWSGDSAAAHEEAIGVNDAIIGGPLAFGGQASFAVENHDLTTYALRSSYTTASLTDLCFAGTLNGDGRKQTGCKINTLSLSCAIGGPLTANMTWAATTDEAYSTALKAWAATDTIFRWQTGTVTIGDASMQCVGFEVNINNSCEHYYTMDGKTTAQQRWPDGIDVGSQVVTFSADVLTRPTTAQWADMTGDTLGVAGSAIMSFVGGTSGTETFTITLANLTRFTNPIPLQAGGGKITYAVTFEAKNDASSISITCQ